MRPTNLIATHANERTTKKKKRKRRGKEGNALRGNLIIQVTVERETFTDIYNRPGQCREIKNDQAFQFHRPRRSSNQNDRISLDAIATVSRVFHDDTANLCLRDIFPSLRGSDISCGTETAKHLLAPKMVLTQYQPRSRQLQIARSPRPW